MFSLFPIVTVINLKHRFEIIKTIQIPTQLAVLTDRTKRQTDGKKHRTTYSTCMQCVAP